MGDSIVSPLGFTSEENYQAAKGQRSAVALHSCEGLAEPYHAAIIDKDALARAFEGRCESPKGLTPLEQAAILSIKLAAEGSGICLDSSKTLFVFSSTKGNIELLDAPAGSYEREKLYLWHTAALIARWFGNPNEPIVVSNACVSGACAQIVAMRMIEAGRYETAVVTGADMASRFVVSGFQSLKALAAGQCRPFDVNRSGLNLGEAAATIIYRKHNGSTESSSQISLLAGSIRNDANHISGPSRTAEGAFLALNDILVHAAKEDIAFVCAHGTATPYNDRMETIALRRAGLDGIPTNSLKGCFGHTLGAAGTLESIISVWALREGIALGTCGFEVEDPDCALPVSANNIAANGSYFLKMLSGFGGSNAALLFSKP
ncbi:MAG: beta-ketoacyl synthase [Tannerellaceae bacterium]|nr:beta-ketoacyl synthase [Tannerellaceae bacterium]